MALSTRDCRDLMLASTDLVNTVGGSSAPRIYLGRPAQNAVRPFIVIRRDGTEHRYGTAGEAPYARTISILTDIVVTSVVADDYEKAEEITQLVRAAVETKEGPTTDRWVVVTDGIDDEEDLSAGNGTFIDIATITWRVQRKSYPTVT